jgi:hypothetical protein
LFTTAARYLSSGCVRVEEVHVLTNWILNGQDGWSPGRIQQVEASEERIDVKVQNPPQLRTVYLTSWVNGAGQVNFRPDIYQMDGTGFVVGQPLAPGEFSDDGQRYVLKAQAYKVEEVPDRPEPVRLFAPRRKERSQRTSNDYDPFSVFSKPKARKATRNRSNPFFFGRPSKPKKTLADIEDDDGVIVNFNLPRSSKVKKKLLKKKTNDKTTSKAAAAASKKKPVTAAAKKKKAEQTAAAQKKTPPAAVQPVKKKKKIEEATASAAKPGAP